MDELTSTMRSLGDNSTNTDTISGPNNHMEDLLYNLGMLFGFLSALLFVVVVFHVCMTCREHRQNVRGKIARTKFVKSQLVVREWISGCGNATPDGSTDHDTVDGEEAPQDADETKDDEKQRYTVNGSSPSRTLPDQVLLAHDDANSSVRRCAICLAPFEDHERVCESNNLVCQHLFHEACMISWLEKHSLCPVCRQPYLMETA